MHNENTLPAEYQMLSLIEDKQLELLKKYSEIEGLPSWPVDIDDPENQIWIKDFFWRVTEEIVGEFLEAWRADKKNQAIEELSDALHFYINIYILVGYKVDKSLDDYHSQYKLYHSELDIQVLALDCVHYLGLSANCLKNKRWKQSPISTDLGKFKTNLDLGFKQLLFTMFSAGLDPKGVYLAYFKKHQKNKERQNSNY